MVQTLRKSPFRLTILLCLLCVTPAGASDYDIVKTTTPKSRIKTVTVERYAYKADQLIKEYYEKYSYDESGKLILHTIHKPDGNITTKNRLTYNKKDLLISYVSSSMSQKKTVKRLYAYTLDSQGRIMTKIVDAPDLKLKIKLVYTYSPDGAYEILKHRKLPHGKEYYIDGLEKYSSDGKRIQKVFSSGDMEIYEYDAKGNVKRTRLQASDVHGDMTYTNSYDDEGNLTAVTMDGIRMLYTYNDRKDLKEEQHFQGKNLSYRLVYIYEYR